MQTTQKILSLKMTVVPVIIKKQQYLQARLSLTWMHLLPCEIPIFFRSSALQQRDKWNIQHQKCCSAKSLHKIVHGIFTFLSITFTLILKTSISLLHYFSKRPVEIINSMDWKSIFLGVFFLFLVLHLSFPEPNFTNETQKQHTTCWFSKRVGRQFCSICTGITGICQRVLNYHYMFVYMQASHIAIF